MVKRGSGYYCPSCGKKYRVDRGKYPNARYRCFCGSTLKPAVGGLAKGERWTPNVVVKRRGKVMMQLPLPAEDRPDDLITLARAKEEKVGGPVKKEIACG